MGVAEFTQVPATTSVARLFNFEIGQDWLKPEHKFWLSQHAVARLRSGGSIWIMGLTSTTGTESFNDRLSKRRADSVITFLKTTLSKDFPVKLELAVGESAARLAGLRDDVEDENWRAVVVSVWDKPVPPPPPTPQPKQECKRLVIGASDGVSIYVFLEDAAGGRKIIEQVFKVKGSLEYIKNCSTDFERKESFLADRSSHPVVIEYARDPASNVVGEVVGHFFRTNRYNIVGEDAALKRLPVAFNISSVPLDALLNGYAFGGPNGDDYVSLGGKVPLYLSHSGMPGYTSIANSSESAESYDVVTDVYGQIVARIGTYASKYPRTESNLSVGIKEGVKDGLKKAAKAAFTLLF